MEAKINHVLILFNDVAAKPAAALSMISLDNKEEIPSETPIPPGVIEPADTKALLTVKAMGNFISVEIPKHKKISQILEIFIPVKNVCVSSIAIKVFLLSFFRVTVANKAVATRADAVTKNIDTAFEVSKDRNNMQTKTQMHMTIT